MAEHNELGKRGEEEACRYLSEQGYRILERNWRFRKAELDIIAEGPDHIAFVEVKARESNRFGNPHEFISKAQQKHLIKAANAYAEAEDLQKDLQFDVVSITFKPEFRLEHFKEAFYPG